MAGMTDRSPLADLVDEVCRANGWSRREVARRAKERGRNLSSSRLGQLLAEYPLGGIQADKIDDIAAGLGISRDRVAVAVVQAMGFRITDTTVTPAEAIRRDPSLPQATKEALLAILRSAPQPRKRGGEHDQQRSAPIAGTYEITKDGDTYVGATSNLRRRLEQHLRGARTDEEREQLERMLADLDAIEEAVPDRPAETG